MQVVVGQHRSRRSASARRRSVGVVTLMLSLGASISRTVPPTAATRAASSVAEFPSSRARRSTSARNTWGVCAAQSVARSGVCAMRRSAEETWIVSETGEAAMTTTIRSQAGSRASRLHSTIGRPAQTTNALGRSAPRRSPLPPAGTIPTTVISSLRPGYAVAGAPPRGRCGPPIKTFWGGAPPPPPTSSTYISSDARIFLARVYICFSPVESPFSCSRMARLRTTSASSKTSPVLIFSRLCLKRRFQFLGIWLTSSRRIDSTFLTSSSPITRRSPALSALQHGTMTGIHDLVADLVDGGLALNLEILDVELLLNHCVANGVPSYA